MTINKEAAGILLELKAGFLAAAQSELAGVSSDANNIVLRPLLSGLQIGQALDQIKFGFNEEAKGTLSDLASRLETAAADRRFFHRLSNKEAMAYRSTAEKLRHAITLI